MAWCIYYYLLYSDHILSWVLYPFCRRLKPPVTSAVLLVIERFIVLATKRYSQITYRKIKNFSLTISQQENLSTTFGRNGSRTKCSGSSFLIFFWKFNRAKMNKSANETNYHLEEKAGKVKPLSFSVSFDSPFLTVKLSH